MTTNRVWPWTDNDDFPGDGLILVDRIPSERVEWAREPRGTSPVDAIPFSALAPADGPEFVPGSVKESDPDVMTL